jgi:phage gpG-like protein
VIDIEIDDRVVMARLNTLPGKLRAALLRKTYDLAEKLKSKVQQNLTNKILRIRSGKLSRSIFEQITNNATEVSGRVYSAGLKYARIQEFGGTIDHPGGTAYLIDSKSGLAKFVSNKDELASHLPRTKPHKITIPAHHYMGAAFDEMKPEIKAGYEEAVKGAAHE